MNIFFLNSSYFVYVDENQYNLHEMRIKTIKSFHSQKKMARDSVYDLNRGLGLAHLSLVRIFLISFVYNEFHSRE